ncbi:MAG: hypothetical protein CMM94_07850 [Rickettsiales bacterium]|nr:hypothetical protein [Rickettsiales bacterium]
MRYKTAICGLVILLAACGGPIKKERSTVWELYDVRHPVPAHSTVPQSRAVDAQRYYDNDAFYTPPRFGMCGTSDISSIGCDD